MAFDTSAYTGATYDNPNGGFLNAKEIKATWAEVNQSCLMRNAQILGVTPSQEIDQNGRPVLKVYQYKSGKKAGGYYIRWRFDVAEPGKQRWCSFSVFVDCLNAGGDIDRQAMNWIALRNDLGILCNLDINNSADLQDTVVPTATGGFIKYAGLEGLFLDFMIEVSGVYNGHANANLVQIFKGEKSTRETYAIMQGKPLAQSVSDVSLAWSRVRVKNAFDLSGGLPGAPAVPGVAAPAVSPATAPAAAKFQPWTPQNTAPAAPAAPAPQSWTASHNVAPAQEDDVPF